MDSNGSVSRSSRVGQINTINLRSKMLRSNSSEHNSVDSQISDDGRVRRIRRRPKRSGSSQSDNKKIADFEKATLVGRLQELLVMEVHQDGSRTYLQLSVRGLYKHVIACITNFRNFSIPPNINASTNISNHLSRNASVRFDFGNQSDSREARSFVSPFGPQPSYELEGSIKKISMPSAQSILAEHPEEEPNFASVPAVGILSPPPPPLSSSFTKLDTSGYSTSTKSPHMNRPIACPVESTTTTMPSLPKPLKRRGRNVSVGLLNNDVGGSSNDVTRSPPKRTNSSSTVSDIHPPLPNQQQQQQQQQQVTYRERLGAYIHPRDMRRLVTPFSASNEPELIVRRHVMLLNFDPLRAIILRDRLLVLVPDGADSILANLEHRIRGGADEVINSIFGHNVEDDEELNTEGRQESNENPGDMFETSALLQNLSEEIHNHSRPEPSSKILNKIATNNDWFQQQTETHQEPTSEEDNQNAEPTHTTKKEDIIVTDVAREASASRTNSLRKFALPRSLSMNALNKLSNRSLPSPAPFSFDQNGAVPDVVDTTFDRKNSEAITDQNDSDSEDDDDEWDEMEGRDWINLPFELLCVDAVLFVIGTMLTVETEEIRIKATDCINKLLTNDSSGMSGDHPLTSIRAVKDAVREMTSRVKGFVQSMNRILDEDEDMALMNLSRLLTHPQRFIQPVPQEVLEEESDEPELILEANLQIVLSILNSLDLIQGQIDTASELVDQKLDALRNRLLFANMVISIFTLAVTCAALIGSFFGMNLVNPMEGDENAFLRVTIGTSICSVVMVVVILWFLVYSGTVPRTSFRGM